MSHGREAITIDWHSSFYGAIEFDLRAEKKIFSFEVEHYLSKQPLRIDLLISREYAGYLSNNIIASFFRGVNIVEYKSPEDGLSITDLSKTLGYAYLYGGLADHVNEIPMEELTVSIFRDSKPKKMFQMLESLGAIISKRANGVYEISKLQLLPVQIIVTKELDAETYVALRLLSKNVTKRDIALFLEKTKNNVNPGERENLSAVLTASMAANRQIYEEFRKEYPEMSDFLMSFFENEFEEVRMEGKTEGKIEGKIEEKKAIAIKLYKRGISPEGIADLVEMTLDKVMEWLGLLQC